MKLTKEQALAHFSELLDMQIARNDRMKTDTEFTDFAACEPLIIGVCAGDGIGPAITAEAERVLRFLLAEEIAAGKVQLRTIEGLTLENRLGIPSGRVFCPYVLSEVKCRPSLGPPGIETDVGDNLGNFSAGDAVFLRLLKMKAK